MEYLKTENLFFRSLEKQDLDNTFKWLHEPIIHQKIGVNIPFSKSKQETWFENLERDSSKIVLAICLNKTKEHIGNISIDMIDLKNRNARFSIFIADQTNRKKGFGSESLEIIKNYSFNYMNLNKIYCKTDSEDQSVINFYLKNGFIIEGELKKHEYKLGKYVDKTLLATFK